MFGFFNTAKKIARLEKEISRENDYAKSLETQRSNLQRRVTVLEKYLYQTDLYTREGCRFAKLSFNDKRAVLGNPWFLDDDRRSRPRGSRP